MYTFEVRSGYDAAILRLSSSARLDRYENIICLPRADVVSPSGTIGAVAGWVQHQIGKPVHGSIITIYYK